MTTETLTVDPANAEFEQVWNDESFRGSSGGLFTNGRTGNRWKLILTFAGLVGDDRRALFGHIGQLRGQRNRLKVNLYDRLRYRRAGAGGGTPLLVGAESAGAVEIDIDGASSTSQWLSAGDFISIGNELKLVTGDVDTVGSNGTIKIWPELHQDYAANQPVEIAEPVGVFFLPEPPSWPIRPHPGDDWLSDVVTLVLEEDVFA